MLSLNDKQPTQVCRWHSFDKTTELELAARTEILRAAQLAISARGAFHLVLAGGTTPRRVYESLRDALTEWGAWHIYFGDERCLPCAHSDRNSHMADLAWLKHVDISAEHIHPIPAEEGASVAAKKYAQLLGKVSKFDLVLLGLGEDGHTASLFPGHDAGDAPDASATQVILNAPKPPPQRVSLSARRLSETHQVIFLVTGSSKEQAVKKWRAGTSIPAASITPEKGVDIYIEGMLLD